MTADVFLLVAMPPSANRMYRRAGGHMHKSTEYRAWLAIQAERIREEAGGDWPIRDCWVSYSVPATRRDLDNQAKPLGDLLQEAGIIENDNLIHRITMQRHCPSEGDQVRISIWRVEPPAWASKRKRR